MRSQTWGCHTNEGWPAIGRRIDEAQADVTTACLGLVIEQMTDNHMEIQQCQQC